MVGTPTVSQSEETLQTSVLLSSGGRLVSVFQEKEVAFTVIGIPSHTQLGLKFEWVADRSSLQEVSADLLSYRFQEFDYAIRVTNGVASRTAQGVDIIAGKRGGLRLLMTQRD